MTNLFSNIICLIPALGMANPELDLQHQHELPLLNKFKSVGFHELLRCACQRAGRNLGQHTAKNTAGPSPLFIALRKPILRRAETENSTYQLFLLQAGSPLKWFQDISSIGNPTRTGNDNTKKKRKTTLKQTLKQLFFGWWWGVVDYLSRQFY